jgi:hypothetical protein
MAVKAINDSAGPDDIMLTLLIFGAYPKIIKNSVPLPSVTQRADAISKITKEIRQLYAKRQITDALVIKNGPNTKAILNLSL